MITNNFDNDKQKKLREVVEEEIELKKQNDKTDFSIKCPYCNSDNVYGISRVVGYFSIIDNWNASKQSELKARQKGNYWSKE